jgi:hypothetical protein
MHVTEFHFSSLKITLEYKIVWLLKLHFLIVFAWNSVRWTWEVLPTPLCPSISFVFCFKLAAHGISHIFHLLCSFLTYSCLRFCSPFVINACIPWAESHWEGTDARSFEGSSLLHITLLSSWCFVAASVAYVFSDILFSIKIKDGLVV